MERPPRSSATWDSASPTRGKGRAMLMLGMIVLGLLMFAALLGFVALCDRV